MKVLIIIKNLGITKLIQFLDFLKNLGYMVFGWFIDFKQNIICIKVLPDNLFCFCCGKQTFSICQSFYIVLCDNCKAQKHFNLLTLSQSHGFFIPYKEFLKVG